MDIVSPGSLERFPSGFHCPVDIVFRSVGKGEKALVIGWVLGIESLAI